MKYILKDGYIDEITFGATIECKNQTCTEYTGTIPNNYSSLEEWVIGEEGKLNAWKVVEGNLVFDNVKYNELQAQWEVDAEENENATHKWVNDKLKNINEIYDDELSSVIGGSSLFSIDDTKKAEIVSMKIIPNSISNNNLKLYITNENMLENKAVDTEINGLTFKINEDRSIKINGTSNADTELVLNGSLTSIEDLFFLKANQNYMQCGLKENVSINLYNYDGTDRELISSKGNGTINISTTKYITCVTLKIESGKKFKNVTIYPMITIGAEEKKYVQYEGNKLITIDFNGYRFNSNNDDYIVINRNDISFHKFLYLYPSNTLYPSDTLFPMEKEQIIKGTINSLFSFDNKTIIQCDKDVNINVRYFPSDYLNKKFATIEVFEDEIALKVGKNEVISSINQSPEKIKLKAERIGLEGYTTINNGFSIDENGNPIIKGGNIELIDTGSGSDPSIEIYDSTQVDTSYENIILNSDLNGKLLLFSWNDNSWGFDYDEWLDIVKTDNDNSIQVRQISNIDYLEVKIVYNDEDHIVYFKDEDNINYLSQFLLPNDFGKVNFVYHNSTDTMSILRFIKFRKFIKKKLTTFKSDGINIKDAENNINSTYSKNGIAIYDENGTKYFNEYGLTWTDEENHTQFIAAVDNLLYYLNGTNQLVVNENGCTSTVFNQTSLEENKKNIKKYTGALKEIKKTDIYKYNLKHEEDKHKKHLGFVIGDKYNYSHEITAVDRNGKETGVDNYSMISLCLQAIKEQQVIIENLQNQIDELKKESDK